MTEDEAANQILSFQACYMTCWRVTDTDGSYRDATEEERAVLDRVRAILPPLIPT